MNVREIKEIKITCYMGWNHKPSDWGRKYSNCLL